MSIIESVLRDEPDEWEDLHVYPINDLLEHDTDGEVCLCDPAIEVRGGKLIYIHNSFDGREESEG